MGIRDDTCDRCNERFDACTCSPRDSDAIAEALGRGSRWPEQPRALGRPIFGTIRSRGVPSQAIREAEEQPQERVDAGLLRGWG
jgi:hypothetical protein